MLLLTIQQQRSTQAKKKSLLVVTNNYNYLQKRELSYNATATAVFLNNHHRHATDNYTTAQRHPLHLYTATAPREPPRLSPPLSRSRGGKTWKRKTQPAVYYKNELFLSLRVYTRSLRLSLVLSLNGRRTETKSRDRERDEVAGKRDAYLSTRASVGKRENEREREREREKENFLPFAVYRESLRKCDWLAAWLVESVSKVCSCGGSSSMYASGKRRGDGNGTCVSVSRCHSLYIFLSVVCSLYVDLQIFKG